MQVPKRIWRKETLTTPGGSTGSCFSWPVGVTWNSSVAYQGGEIISERDNPNWKYDIRVGRSATTPFIANDISIEYSPGYALSRRHCKKAGVPAGVLWGVEELSGYTNDGFSDVAVPDVPPSIVNAMADARARLEFIKRARSAQGSFRGSTVLAELADTLRTIRNPARGLRESIDSYSSVARRRIRKAIGRDPRGVRARDLSDRQSRAAQRALSDSWLEAQFGWLPLVGDIRDGLRSYNRFANRSPRRHVYAESNDSTVPVITIQESQSRNIYFATEIHTFVESNVHYYGAVKVNMSSFSSSLVEEAGFRVRDFVPALWEWIPYSFLVDYFTNIGDIVEAASFPRSDIAWCARTFVNTSIRDGTRVTYRKLSSNAYPLSNYTEIQACYPSTIKIRRKYVFRDEYTGSFVPSFQLEIPGWRDFKKWLNIGALANLRGMRR